MYPYDHLNTDYYNEPRYQDSVSHDRFSLIVSQGPCWNRLATKFRTPFNIDLVHWLEGPAGNFYSSNDSGNWWFRASYMPLKITWDKTVGYRLNHTDPIVHRNGLSPYSRMISKRFDSVSWPKPIDLVPIEFSARRTEHRILSPLEALNENYLITSTVAGAIWSSDPLPVGLSGDPFIEVNFPYSTGDTFAAPYFWLGKPVQPNEPPPEPILSDYQYDVSITTVVAGPPASSSESITIKTLGLYNTDHNAWQVLKNQYDADLIQYNNDLAEWLNWKNNTPVYVLLKNGRVTNILSSTKQDDNYLHVGLAPFYDDSENFIGWGAVKEERVVLTHTVQVGTELPISPISNLFYLDTNDSSEGLYVLNESTWSLLAHGDSFPTAPQINDLFYLHLNSTNPDEGIYLWTGSDWERQTTPESVETYGNWLPYGTGTLSPLEVWNEKNIGTWVLAADDFDFNKDPRHQGPY